MSAALQTAAAALIAARHAVTDAEIKLRDAVIDANAAEVALIEAFQKDYIEHVGSAIVCNSYALVVKEEFWEHHPGQKVEMHRLMGVAS